MLGIGKQRGTAAQRDEITIGYSDIWGGVGVDQGWFGTVLPEVLLQWMPSWPSPLAVVVAGAVVSRRDRQQLMWPIEWKAVGYCMVKSPGHKSMKLRTLKVPDGLQLVGGVRHRKNKPTPKWKKDTSGYWAAQQHASPFPGARVMMESRGAPAADARQ